jgi:hypothetical protein
MASQHRAFEMPCLFGGLSDSGMPDAPCAQGFCGTDGTVCELAYTNQPTCVDTPGDCNYKFDIGLAAAGAIVGGVIGGIFAT